MKKYLIELQRKAQEAIRSNPVEIAIALSSCIIQYLVFEKVITGWQSLPFYFPILFIFSYTLNQCSADKKLLRWFYYASLLLIVPFAWTEEPREFSFYMVNLGVFFALYFISKWQTDNERFVDTALRFLRSLTFAGALSLITQLLLISIFFSIQSIFDIWDTQMNRFLAYVTPLVFMVELPLLFMMFHREKTESFIPSRVTKALLNYVLSPALLIYCAILYAYVIKITATGVLPKGQVAMITVCFTIALFVLKGCRPLMGERTYAWLYNRASWVALPPLAMLWIGTLYRINEYGFTVERVYLVVVAVLLTLSAFLFFTQKTGRYLYVLIVGILLFGGVTYIPGFSATDIERISQAKRGTDQKKEVVTEYHDFELQEPVLTEGFKSVEPVFGHEVKGMMRFDLRNDSLLVYDRQSKLIYQADVRSLAEQQMRKVGLTFSDTIDMERDYSPMMQVELDSALLVFESMGLKQDSVYHINNINSAFYLKK